METPEKIYIFPRQGGDYTPYWKTNSQDEFGIEYVLKDAFIEKTGELLAKMIREVTYEDLEGDSVQHHNKMEFIEDFKNYLKVK